MTDELPEPRRVPLTADALRKRQWRVLQAGLYVAILYAMVHKLAVPLFLKLTTLAASPYARVDAWAVLPLALAFQLSDHRRKSPWTSVLAGMCVVYGVYEVYELSQGRFVGWLAFSRLLSSIPIAAGSMILLSARCFDSRPLWAWVGALGFSVFLLVVEIQGRFHGL